MVLPICVEVFVRLLFHIVKFSLHYWFYVLIFIFIITLLRTPMGTGVVGWMVNLIGLLPTGVTNYMGPFLMAIVWGVLILQSPINIVLRIFLLPFFVAAGFAWDALSNWGYLLFAGTPYIGGICYLLNIVPLTPVVALTLRTKTINTIFAVGVSLFWAKFWLWGGCNWLNISLKTAESFFKWLYSG